MKIKNRILAGLWIFVVGIACSTTNKIEEVASSEPQPEESISVSINEAAQFEFERYDSTWTGTFTTFKLDENDEKLEHSKFIPAKDSSWNDFEEIKKYLKLYDIPPQKDIEGWVPDSGNLPKRVYNFEVFDGDTTKEFSYQDPENDLRKYWQSQNILVFIAFIENDLKWVEVTEE